jgi:DNA-binding transcriptional ArsR family regulator
MKLSLMDEQEIRTFAQKHPELLGEVIDPEAKEAHREDHFFGEALTIAMFLSFAKSLADVLEGALEVTKILTKSEELFKWVRKRKAGSNESTKASLSERILILAFEAYVNRKAGVRADALSTVLGVEVAEIDRALTALEKRGVMRKTKDGAWKYVKLS